MKPHLSGELASQRLTGALFTTAAMQAIFCDRARVQAMLDFERALAVAQVRVALIPASAAPAIAKQCDATLYDLGTIARATREAGNPAIPLVQALTTRVAAEDADAARFVHWGATSQDVMDTGLVLQLMRALHVIENDLTRLSPALTALMQQHADTLLAGRTLLQQATPITFGLKAAGWLSAIDRHRGRIREMYPRLAVVQFGGASGTLAALGDRGLSVAAALAEELRLALPELPWHAHRDRVAEVATTLGLLVGTLGKVARDVSLLMQTEVAEAFEPAEPGRGGSSTMPHKRNPVSAAAVLAAATRVPGLVATMLLAMVQEHERGLGGWHAEWETLPEICLLAAGALAHTVQTIEGLEIDAARMMHNLELTGGLVLAEAVAMALAQKMGKLGAHDLVERACRLSIEQKKSLRHVLGADPEVQLYLTAADLDRLLDPRNYTGQAQALIARVLTADRS
ncbi:MAG: 3-carboxy-cis,cis-muconate cycloisomerase [Casimicrobiaceae bacterium]